jgi:hypothetical protein
MKDHHRQGINCFIRTSPFCYFIVVNILILHRTIEKVVNHTYSML